jgi:hypothetical protein
MFYCGADDSDAGCFAPPCYSDEQAKPLWMLYHDRQQIGTR